MASFVSQPCVLFKPEGPNDLLGRSLHLPTILWRVQEDHHRNTLISRLLTPSGVSEGLSERAWEQIFYVVCCCRDNIVSHSECVNKTIAPNLQIARMLSALLLKSSSWFSEGGWRAGKWAGHVFARGDGSHRTATHTDTPASLHWPERAAFLEPTEKTWHNMLGSLEVTGERADKGWPVKSCICKQTHGCLIKLSETQQAGRGKTDITIRPLFQYLSCDAEIKLLFWYHAQTSSQWEQRIILHAEIESSSLIVTYQLSSVCVCVGQVWPTRKTAL